MIFVIDMLNQMRVYIGNNMQEALEAKQEYMSFFGLIEDTCQIEVIMK